MVHAGVDQRWPMCIYDDALAYIPCNHCIQAPISAGPFAFTMMRWHTFLAIIAYRHRSVLAHVPMCIYDDVLAYTLCNHCIQAPISAGPRPHLNRTKAFPQL